MKKIISFLAPRPDPRRVGALGSAKLRVPPRPSAGRTWNARLYTFAATLGLAASWMSAGAGCTSSLGEGDPGHTHCGSAGECLDGFTCDEASNTCVPNGTLTDGGHGGKGGGTGNDGGPDGSTTCGQGETNCGGQCVTLGTDVNNCGGCGAVCSAPPGGTATCTGGVCGFDCDTGKKACGDTCIDAASDPGSCGDTCTDPSFPDKCAPDGCVDEQSDVNHCGSCTNVCAAPVSGGATGSPACATGTCDVTCNAATSTKCSPINGGKACVDTKTDPQFCGGCATQCAPGKECVSGLCADVCPPGEVKCGNACVNLQSDPSNCGQCSNACPSILNSNNHCQSAACKPACDAGFTECKVNALTGLSACVNLQTDETHCGNCNTACGANQVCVAGVCKQHILASSCWECGNGNSFPLCCPLGGKTICTTGSTCPQ